MASSHYQETRIGTKASKKGSTIQQGSATAFSMLAGRASVEVQQVVTSTSAPSPSSLPTACSPEELQSRCQQPQPPPGRQVIPNWHYAEKVHDAHAGHGRRGSSCFCLLVHCASSSVFIVARGIELRTSVLGSAAIPQGAPFLWRSKGQLHMVPEVGDILAVEDARLAGAFLTGVYFQATALE